MGVLIVVIVDFVSVEFVFILVFIVMVIVGYGVYKTYEERFGGVDSYVDGYVYILVVDVDCEDDFNDEFIIIIVIEMFFCV